MKPFARQFLTVVLSTFVALTVWVLMHSFHGGWVYLGYLITFPLVRILAWNWTIEGLPLLACMAAYSGLFALLFCALRWRALRWSLVAGHVGLALVVLLKEWPFWLP